jgi:hypothetical protein
VLVASVDTAVPFGVTSEGDTFHVAPPELLFIIVITLPTLVADGSVTVCPEEDEFRNTNAIAALTVKLVVLVVVEKLRPEFIKKEEEEQVKELAFIENPPVGLPNVPKLIPKPAPSICVNPVSVPPNVMSPLVSVNPLEAVIEAAVFVMSPVEEL